LRSKEVLVPKAAHRPKNSADLRPKKQAFIRHFDYRDRLNGPKPCPAGKQGSATKSWEGYQTQFFYNSFFLSDRQVEAIHNSSKEKGPPLFSSHHTPLATDATVSSTVEIKKDRCILPPHSTIVNDIHASHTCTREEIVRSDFYFSVIVLLNSAAV